mmetsp:Transcript_76024/g.163171  ORF Transcript_76024/g.163171 Transcript_76024/m.163171 type:complete len:570 (-) Transcript_76024:263-1972(-)
MELATALIWTLRIVLPIILFCIYFKLQSPKEEQFSGSTKNRYTRGKLLAHRKAVLAAPVPEELETIAMKDQVQAPALFANSGRTSRGDRGSRREDRGDRPPRDRGDRESRKERSEGERPRRRDRERPREAEEEEPAVEEPAADEGALDTPLLSTAEESQEKMHIESLLNYVAFNRSAQQRIFLPDEDSAPPPPPKPRRPPPTGAPIDESAKAVSAETSEKANLEAQMVLRGALNFKRADVATNLYEKLLDSQVEISERTFKLMIDACVLARDLKAASDFLMRMETYGYNPDSDILDRVMDLYSQQKSVREQEKQAPMQGSEIGALFGSAKAEGDMAMDVIIPQHIQELLEGPRAKLKSDAPIFVPSFGIPPPPPHAAPVEGGAPDTAAGETTVETPPVQRTKLTTSAKPFEPSFAMPMPFDPYSYSADHGWAEEQWQGEGQTQKAKGGANHKNGRPSKGEKVSKGAEGNHGREAEWWPNGDSGGEAEWWPEGGNYNGDEGEWWPAEESWPEKDGGATAKKGVAKAKPKYKAKEQPPTEPPKESAKEAVKETKKQQQPQAKVWKPKVENS